ncbi:ABC transporter ATP-binding protein [Cellvibrio japonicus]|uniref:AtsC n=1 Tax=Cellvibrio japonicus (strain Ueda107) TaxID=498211 RepID=B3PJY1_CELJU|nr:ABC transporter ATP-binding protein [Cellvibrio japonicus]ACE82978.1 AtsC [Cellvibrio japonicus Ueda107]QEI12753.1 ABC transporter ATP-binding protein [Cellvibrio japonicus]QEI16327.1 ABC transporter ATP-binding protein [Cellvibrio japonicus]QEI19905.1 ABC transporter ATP-binding protein [Cellvibrio japonicus]
MVVHHIQDRVLRLKNIGKHFHHQGSSLEVLKDINLTVLPGEFVSILGSSGCGKSTLLRLLVGLDVDYSGEISLGGAAVTGPSLTRGIVFQEHRLLPWLTVADNVGIALKNSSASVAEKKDLVQQHIALVGLQGFENAWPHQLSGGMSQRVAIARALVNRPDVLLLDEPFGALDAMTRGYLQQELQHIWRKENITMILVTHDVEEAVFLADRIVVMEPNPGRIKRVISVPSPHPRDRNSAQFNSIKRQALAEISGEDTSKVPAPTFVDFGRLGEVRLSW